MQLIQLDMFTIERGAEIEKPDARMPTNTFHGQQNQEKPIPRTKKTQFLHGYKPTYE